MDLRSLGRNRRRHRVLDRPRLYCSRVPGAFHQHHGAAGRPHHGGEMPKTQRGGAFARILAIVVTVVIGSAMHAQAQTAEAPVWKVGYKWTFHSVSGLPPVDSTWQREVVETLPGGHFSLQMETGRKLVFDAETNSLDPRGAEY